MAGSEMRKAEYKMSRSTVGCRGDRLSSLSYRSIEIARRQKRAGIVERIRGRLLGAGAWRPAHQQDKQASGNRHPATKAASSPKDGNWCRSRQCEAEHYDRILPHGELAR
jgi:hypothetical protein